MKTVHVKACYGDWADPHNLPTNDFKCNTHPKHHYTWDEDLLTAFGIYVLDGEVGCLACRGLEDLFRE